MSSSTSSRTSTLSNAASCWRFSGTTRTCSSSATPTRPSTAGTVRTPVSWPMSPAAGRARRWSTSTRTTVRARRSWPPRARCWAARLLPTPVRANRTARSPSCARSPSEETEAAGVAAQLREACFEGHPLGADGSACKDQHPGRSDLPGPAARRRPFPLGRTGRRQRAFGRRARPGPARRACDRLQLPSRQGPPVAGRLGLRLGSGPRADCLRLQQCRSGGGAAPAVRGFDEVGAGAVLLVGQGEALQQRASPAAGTEPLARRACRPLRRHRSGRPAAKNRP